MGRVVLACKSDEEGKMATCPVFSPHSLHTDREAESVRQCVGFRSGITVVFLVSISILIPLVKDIINLDAVQA